MSVAENYLFELRAIKRTLSIAYAEKVDAYLNEVIRTPIRRKMWIALDGERLPIEIATEVGVTPAAVTFFLKTVTNARIIEYVRGQPPRKIIDHIPSDWFIEVEDE